MAGSGIPVLPLVIVTSGGILLYSGVVNQPTTTVLRNVLKGNATAPAVTTASVTTGSGSGSTPSGPIQTTNGIQNYALAGMVASTYGWPPGTKEFSALTQVIAMESGGNPSATNASSGAYGIAQALGHGTASTRGSVTNQYGPIQGMNLPNSTYVGANSGNAMDQLIWMCEYIKVKFGDPIAAYNFHIANNYY